MLADGPSIRVLPRLDGDSAFFWTSGADGRLRLLRCGDCRRYFHPPSPRCPHCLSSRVAPEPVSGRGTVESFTVNHQQWIPGSEPYAIAWVAVDEQPDVRLTTNVVGVEPADLHAGMAVEVVFAHEDDVYLPLFRPVP